MILSTWIKDEHGSAPQYPLVGRQPSVVHSFYTLTDRFIIRPSYVDINVSQALHKVMQISSHKIEIEVEKYAQIPLEVRVCELFHQVESKERCVFHCNNTCQNQSYCLPSEPLFPYNLVHTQYNVRQDVGTQVTRVVIFDLCHIFYLISHI